MMIQINKTKLMFFLGIIPLLLPSPLALSQSDDEVVDDVIELNTDPVKSAPRKKSRSKIQIPDAGGSGEASKTRQESQTREVQVSNRNSIEIRGGYGWLFSGASQGSKELQTELPLQDGHLRIFETRYHSLQNIHMLKFKTQNVVFSNLPDVEPNSVDLARQYVALISHKKPFVDSQNKWTRNLSFGGGLYYGVQKLQRTEPFAVLTSQHSAGVNFGAMHTVDLIEKLDLNTNIDFDLPIVFREYYDRTGSYSYGASAEFGMDLSYDMVPWQAWSIGAHGKMTNYVFAGNGEQGVKNGTTQYTDFWFPIEIKLRF